MSSLLIFVLIVGVIGFIGWSQIQRQLTTLLTEAGLSDIADLTQLPQRLIDKASVTSLNQIVLVPGDHRGNTDRAGDPQSGNRTL